MSALCALIWPLMTVNLYLFTAKRWSGADSISSQNKAPCPVRALLDTWGPNVAGRASDGSLIRARDSHLSPSAGRRADARAGSLSPASNEKAVLPFHPGWLATSETRLYQSCRAGPRIFGKILPVHGGVMPLNPKNDLYLYNLMYCTRIEEYRRLVTV